MKINNNQINSLELQSKSSGQFAQDKNINSQASSYKSDQINISSIKRNYNILFVGMNKDASYELKKLRENIAKSDNNIKVIGVLDKGYSVSVDSNGNKTELVIVKDKQGNSYNLADKQGINDYVKTFNLSSEQSQKIVNAINTYDIKARDEIAGIAEVWSDAEKGKSIPSRLLLSGHSTGNGIFGDNNGEISFDSIDKLADAMPKAASQIEDLHISGCYAGGQHNIYKYNQIFPNLKTVWGYTNSAPGALSGAEAHEKIWEKATRGDTTVLNRNIVANTRKAENVAVWSKTNGFDDGKLPMTLQQVLKQVNKTEGSYDKYYNGDEEVDDPYSNDLRDFYDNLQDLIQHPDLPGDKRQELEGLKEQTIRLIFFSRIENSFSKNYGNEINKSLKEVGMKSVNFKDLTRKDALQVISEFEDKYNNIDNPSQELQKTYELLTTGLRDLDSSIIPQSWI